MTTPTQSDRTAPSAGSVAVATAAALRASDADRHATVTRLQDAVARGLLTHDEGSERMAAAYEARFLADLPPLTADLPASAPATSSAAPGWRALLALLALQVRAVLTGPAPGSRPSRRRLAVLGGVVVAVIVLLVLGAGAVHGLFGGPHQLGVHPGH
jgi:Domain of unknown function (DUF1707)